ncbi:hypothetical protein BCA37_25260 [Mycobacterium sp. djl-10]|nr:hypothetical protein BCA37_25260 [Mycobacterium sp. djl-10]
MAAAGDEDRASAAAIPPVNPRALHHVVRPIRRAGRFYARSWQGYLGERADDLPLARPTLALGLQALRDEVVLSGFRLMRPLGDAETAERIGREVRDAVAFYGERDFLQHPERFFETPPALREVTTRSVRIRGRTCHRITYDSGFAPRIGEPGRDRWLGYTANNRGYALLLRHRGPRPWLVCVHGALMGRGWLDLTLFRAWHLFDDLGLNVLLPVLPLHGPRSTGLPAGTAFPGEDVLDDIHATAQAVWDVRRLLAWIRLEEPHARIGLNSISLGGLVAGLTASLEDGLSCAILGVPVADLTTLLSRHAGISRTDPRRETVEAAAPLGRMVSSLSLSPRVPMRGRFIYAGVADQLVHPREQVIRLWEHWGRPEIVWYQGGHTGFFHSRPVQPAIDAALVQSGLVNS